MLTLRERMGLPGQKVRWTGRDATLDRIGAIDWGDQPRCEAPSYIMHDVGELLSQLQNAPDVTDDVAEMIALLELLTFIVLAVLHGARWKDHLAIYVSDSQNTRIRWGNGPLSTPLRCRS